MSIYEQSKKVRRVSAVIYLLFMAVIVGGTYISQQEKGSAEKEGEVVVIPDKELFVPQADKALIR